jgi:hypothetical protein
MNDLTAELDWLFGFQSNWTQQRGHGCYELNGTINIDEEEIDQILGNFGDDPQYRTLLTRFLAGHEKGHHLQEIVWPKRSYATDHHCMEIEADLIGACVLARANREIPPDIPNILTRFDDAYRIAKGIGVALGDTDENNPHHPWAEQRELAVVKGPEIYRMYRHQLTPDTYPGFANDMRIAAAKMKERGL